MPGPHRAEDLIDRYDHLRGLHAAVQPRTYLEIGVNDGRSLALSRARSIGVDPSFKVTAEQDCALQLVKATSDDFFARPDAAAAFGGTPVDLALIDGLHVFEYALRDFMNIERLCSWTSVVVFDDMLPRSVSEAARDRHTLQWAGDVYKVADVLRRYRPDLLCLPLDTAPTGVLVVLGVDPTSTVLHDHYDEIVAEYAVPDPQDVTPEVLERRGSADPEVVLSSDVWSRLRAVREEGAERDPSLVEPLRALLGTGPVGPVQVPDPTPWPVRRPVAPPPAAAPSPARRPPTVRRAARSLGRAVVRSLRHRTGR